MSSASTEWWVRSHQDEEVGETEAAKVQSDKERRVQGNDLADEGAKYGARMSAEGKRASLPMDIEEAYGVYKKNGGQGRPELQWRIHKPEHWREPRRLHPRMEELLKEFPGEMLTTVPLHLEMWHPTLQACGRCERKEEATTRFRCPHCGHESPDSDKTREHWRQTGHYVSTNPDAPAHIRSFHFEAAVSRPLALLAEEFCNAENEFHATGSQESRRTFKQKREARAWVIERQTINT